MSTAIQWIIYIPKILSALIDIVDIIEDKFPMQGKGKEKLDAARGMLEASEDVAQEVASQWPKIQSLIGVIVKLRNATGSWKSDD